MKNIFRTTLITFITAILFSSTALAGFNLVATEDEAMVLNYKLFNGQTITDSVTVTNNSDEDLSLRIYGADGVPSTQGSFSIANSNDEQRAVGIWLQFSEPIITIEPNSRLDIPYTISIPNTVPPGTYAGGIAAETIAGDEDQEAGSTMLSVISRFALKMYINIPGKVIHQPGWTDFSHSLEENNINKFNLTFENNGNTHVIVESEIEILGWPEGNVLGQDPETLSYDPVEQERLFKEREKNYIKLNAVDLFQGDSISLPSYWNKRPVFGSYTARATVTFYEYNVITGEKTDPEVLVKEINFTVIWWDLIILVSLFIILFTGYVVYKLSHLSSLRKKCVLYTVKPNETLSFIAKETGTNWKLLAKINKIKPPYTIEPGQKILVQRKKK